MRAVRQVLLHRPHPRAVHVGRCAARGIRGGRGRLGAAGQPGARHRSSARCSARGPSRSSASARSASAAPLVLLAARRADRAGCAAAQGTRRRGRRPPGRARRARRSPRCAAPWARTSSPRILAFEDVMTGNGRSWRWSRPARGAGRRLGLRPRGPGEPAQAALARRRAGARRRQPERETAHVLATADGGLDALLRLRGGRQDPGHQPVPPARRTELRAGGGDPGRRPRAVAAGGRPGPGRLRHRHQGQVHHLVGPRPPADRPRPHRAMVGGNIGVVPYDPDAGGRLRLLGDRGVQLPGDRPRRSPRRSPP